MGGFMRNRQASVGAWRYSSGVVVVLLAAAAIVAGRGGAASSTGCEGGGFTVLGLTGDQTTTVAAAAVPTTFLVKGKYVEFTVVANSFGILNYTFTGAPNPLDMTGGVRTIAFASKTPDHRGLTLTSGVSRCEAAMVCSVGRTTARACPSRTRGVSTPSTTGWAA